MKKIKALFWNIVYSLLGHLYPRGLVSIHFYRSFGFCIDWKSPKDINEKINWLKFYGDTTCWVDLADKFKVREYVACKGFSDMLVPLLGKWDRAEDIDWDSLPEKFVMKTNHGSGDALICRDKAALDCKTWTETFAKLLQQKYGSQMGEPHYNKIKPCVIAEELLDNTKQKIPSSSLVDYKVWTFNGCPKYIWVCYNRTKHSCEVGVYDTDWNFHPEYSVSNSHYILSDKVLPRPASLDEMLRAASVLSKGFPELRMDFYEVDGKPYFGEMTFSSASGMNNFYTPEFLHILGDYCKLKDK